MQILVTVGTTPFNSLIRWSDSQLGDHSVVFQISSGSYKPNNGKWLRFGDIDPLYEWADIIITHAGAGSVYSLLEKGKKIVVVPNLERRDPHQLELANYIEKCRYAYVLHDLSKIAEAVNAAIDYSAAPYTPYKFFAKDEIFTALYRDFSINEG